MSRWAYEPFDEKYEADPNSGCWLWARGTFANGYGQYWIGRPILAHKFAWERKHGAVPDGLCVCHHCDTPLCVNPNHLFVGTNAENTADRERKGRGYKGPQPWHTKLSDGDVRGIRALRRAGWKLSELASVYGVTIQTISDITTGRRRTLVAP